MAGKGGVGKSTVSAAAALAAAEAGERVLAVSLGDAHALGEVLDREPAGEGPAPVPCGGPGTLELLGVDTLELAAGRWRLAGAVAAAGGLREVAEALPAEELTTAPGIEEFLGLCAVADRAGQGRWDRIVVDCPATAGTLRLLELPAAVSTALERAWPRHRRLGRPQTSPRMMAAVAAAEQLESLAARAAALLADRARVEAVVVTAPGRVARAETRRLLTGIGLTGMRVGRLVANRHPAGPAAEAARAVAADYAAAAPVTVLPALGDEPVGAAALAPLASLLAAAPEHGAATGAEPGVARVGGTGLDAVYEMLLPLPHADPDRVRVGRAGDHLVVSASGVRRRVPLAPVLRRCVVRGAVLSGGELRVRFAPDPKVWPR